MGFLSMWSYFVLESHCQLDSLLPTKSQCMLSLEEPDKNSRTKYNHHHYWKKKLPLHPTCAKVPKHRYIWQSNNHWLTLIQNTWHIKRADGLTDLNYYFSLLVKPWVNSLKKILMLGKIEGRRRRGADRGWDGWMASPTQWTWVWTSSRRQWKTRKPGTLQSIGLQRVRHDLGTEQ